MIHVMEETTSNNFVSTPPPQSRINDSALANRKKIQRPVLCVLGVLWGITALASPFGIFTSLILLVINVSSGNTGAVFYSIMFVMTAIILLIFAYEDVRFSMIPKEVALGYLRIFFIMSQFIVVALFGFYVAVNKVFF